MKKYFLKLRTKSIMISTKFVKDKGKNKEQKIQDLQSKGVKKLIRELHQEKNKICKR